MNEKVHVFFDEENNLIIIGADDCNDEQLEQIVWRTEASLKWELYEFVQKLDESFEEEE